MTGYVALLRAVNVGGTGKLAMTELAAICVAAGLTDVRTYIASGNVVFGSSLEEAAIRDVLETRLAAHAGRRVGVIVRNAAEIAGVAARNPFADAPGKRVMALFTDEVLPEDPFDRVTGVAGEGVRLGLRELFVHYPDGMAKTKLRIPAERSGTARNMNTVARLADMAASIG